MRKEGERRRDEGQRDRENERESERERERDQRWIKPKYNLKQAGREETSITLV